MSDDRTALEQHPDLGDLAEFLPPTTRTRVAELKPGDRVLLAASPPARTLEVLEVAAATHDDSDTAITFRNPEGRVFTVCVADTSTAQVIDTDTDQ